MGADIFIKNRPRHLPGPLGLFQAELCGEGFVLLTKVLIFQPGGAEGFVGVHVVVGHIYHASGNVGTVVAYTLQSGEQVRPDESAFDAARTLLQPQDVVYPELFFQIINNLLQRFHLIGFFQILLPESLEGKADNLIDGTGQNRQLMLGGAGEAQVLGMELFCCFHQIQGMVTNALEVVCRLR